MHSSRKFHLNAISSRHKQSRYMSPGYVNFSRAESVAKRYSVSLIAHKLNIQPFSLIESLCVCKAKSPGAESAVIADFDCFAVSGFFLPRF